MLKHVHSIVAAVARRFRSRAVLELENLALRHQLHVLRRQRPGRPRLFTIDRLLWVWLYRFVAALSGHDGVGQAGHRCPMAPSRLPPVLALALEIRAKNSDRHSGFLAYL
jgi:hypothetical protein